MRGNKIALINKIWSLYFLIVSLIKMKIVDKSHLGLSFLKVIIINPNTPIKCFLNYFLWWRGHILRMWNWKCVEKEQLFPYVALSLEASLMSGSVRSAPLSLVGQNPFQCLPFVVNKILTKEGRRASFRFAKGNAAPSLFAGFFLLLQSPEK